MYDIKWIRENAIQFDDGLRKRGQNVLSKDLLMLDDERRRLVSAAQSLQESRNASSKAIGQAMAAKDLVKAETLKAEVAGVKDRIAAAEAEQKQIEAELSIRLAAIPNIPLEDVPVGADESGNVLRSTYGTHPGLNDPKQHFELGEALHGMDFEAAGKLSGSRFVVLKGEIARLQRAIGQFMLDLHVTEHGYTEVDPPLLVRDEIMFGTAQLPKFYDDQFTASRIRAREELLDTALEDLNPVLRRRAEAGDVDALQTVKDLIAAAPTKEDFWLIPTAEVPLTNLVRDMILPEGELPLRFAALTPCFRAEAGAAGRDTRGMLRQHQFAKVELVSIVTPDNGIKEHERMLAAAETVLKKLDIAYRVMTLCTGDMGFGARKTYDIEAWLPGQGAYREISSCSYCGDFQARRMSARYRDGGGAVRHVHTLNGSGVAVGRALIAVMENYQQGDGSIAIPAVLQPYMGNKTKIEMKRGASA
jgi:seryl-tRNA synthetase